MRAWSRLTAICLRSLFRRQPALFVRHGLQRVGPYRKPADGGQLADWKADLYQQHRTVRAHVEHALARMRTFKILRHYRRAARTLTDTASGNAHLHNIILAG